MPDPVVQPVTPVTPASVVETPVTPAVPQSTLETPVIQGQSPAQPETPPQAIPQPTVLGEAPTVPPVPPIETPKTEPQTPQASPETTNKEGSQSAEPAPPPTYEPFKLPENLTFAEERMKEFTQVLSENKASQEMGQKLVDFHVAEITKAVDDYTKSLQTSWDKQRNDWKDLFTKDPELGGEKTQETVTAGRSFIQSYGGSVEQQNEVRELLNTSGLGNHPAIIRMFKNAYQAVTKEGSPLAAVKPPTAMKSKTQILYGNLG